MRCPFCSSAELKVLDSRPARDGLAIKRRRECEGCSRRFTTFEEIESPSLFVVKRDGTREPFSEEKCLKSMLLACRKRQISIDLLKSSASHVKSRLIERGEDEVSSRSIGALVLQELFALDSVAYVRFASVYEEFETLDDFRKIVDHVAGSPMDDLLKESI